MPIATHPSASGVTEPTEADKYQYDIFISYQWDYQHLVTELHTLLTAEGYKCWMDKHDMGGGQVLYGEIAKGLKTTKIMVSCISEKYLESASCELEVVYAHELMKQKSLHVIPLRLEKVPLPFAGAIGLLLTRLIYVDFKEMNNHNLDWKGHKNFSALLKRINDILGGNKEIVQVEAVMAVEPEVITQLQSIDVQAAGRQPVEPGEPVPADLMELFTKFKIPEEAQNALRKEQLLDLEILTELSEEEIASYGGKKGVQINMKKMLREIKTMAASAGSQETAAIADVDILTDERLYELSSVLMLESQSLRDYLKISTDDYNSLVFDKNTTLSLAEVNAELFLKWLKIKGGDDERRSVSTAMEVKCILKKLRRMDLAKKMDGWIKESMKDKHFDSKTEEQKADAKTSQEHTGVCEPLFREIARKFGGDDLKLGLAFGFTAADVSTYKEEERRKEDRMTRMMVDWNRGDKAPSDEEAKIQELVRIFTKMQRGDLVKVVTNWPSSQSTKTAVQESQSK